MIALVHPTIQKDNVMPGGASGAAELVIFGETLIDDFPGARVVGGAPLNVARTMAVLDCHPLLISRVGQDDAALDVITELRRFGLDETGLQTDYSHSTGLVNVEMTSSSHRFNILSKRAYDYIDAAGAKAAVAQAFRSAPPRCIYFGTLAQRHETSRACLHALLENAETFTFLDLNLRDGQFTSSVVIESLNFADIVKLNEDELRFVLEQAAPGLGDLHIDPTNDALRADLQSLLLNLTRQFSLQAIIVTLGERGYLYFGQSGDMFYNATPPAPVTVVDTVGCGDAFSAVFLTGLIKGWPIRLTLERAHAFAASICTLRGAVAPDLVFYNTWRRQWSEHKEPQ